jgi:uncharacterized membrane protein
MDNFYEQLVTTYETVQYKAIGGVTFISGALAIFMMLFGQIIPCLFLILIGAGAFYFKRYLYLEYEYEFTNGEIDIDKIIGRNKRKRVASFNIKQVEILAPDNSNHIRDLPNKPKKEIRFYPETSKAVIYTAVLKYNGEMVRMKFAFDEGLINICYKYNPRNVKKI